MNLHTKRMLAWLQSAVEAQRKADEMFDDLAAEITGNGLNEQQREELEEFVKNLATSLEGSTFKPVEVDMTHLQQLLRTLESCQP